MPPYHASFGYLPLMSCDLYIVQLYGKPQSAGLSGLA